MVSQRTITLVCKEIPSVRIGVSIMIRLGIIGTGRIANRFASDAWQGTNARITAVFNPHTKNAESFGKKHQVSVATGNWNIFLEQIDAAYIASPTCFHAQYIKMLIDGGKHILCEKPMVLDKQEATYLFQSANKKNVILIEAIKTAYCPGFIALLNWIINNNRIGEIRDVETCFTKLENPSGRELTDRTYGGSMTELGTYGCFAVIKILGYNYQNIHFSVQRNQKGIDIFTKVFLEFGENKKTGLVKSGLGVKSEGEMIISGTKGYIVVKAPWWQTTHFEVRYEDVTKCEEYDYPFIGNGLQYELQYFLNRIQGKPITDYVTEQESIILAEIMEQFLKAEAKYRK